ncbi:universal stress protein [Paraburkholderia ferrariae]|uniref:universal stress protein n=1 Tax=Paraburkholderia ferrariae TaxID=386056 RepID=UPI0004848681|nr:universal stress protein [Paraburkholderia ferrariae]
MEYRSILVHLDESEHAQSRLDIALRIAKRHGAHVSVLFAPVQPEHRADYARFPEEGYWAARRRELAERCREHEHAFHARLAEQDLKGTWRTTEDAQHDLLRRARFADLIVVGQTGPGDPLQARVTLAAGRPVLWVPSAGAFPTIGERVLVAWDDGQSATRALYDALPFVRLASHTTLVTVTPSRNQRDRIPGADAGLVLARHGLDVEVVGLHPAPTGTICEALLARVEQSRSDLLVMGAYGHARWKELILGGVTKTLMDSMPLPVPVLMSH